MGACDDQAFVPRNWRDEILAEEVREVSHKYYCSDYALRFASVYIDARRRDGRVSGETKL